MILTNLLSASAFAQCDIPTARHSIQISHSKHDEAWVDAVTPYKISAVEYQLSWQGRSWQASHEYLFLHYPSAVITAPIMNGHLHTLSLGYRSWFKTPTTGNVHWQLLPTLAVSSNFLKSTDQIQLSTLRMDGYLLWQHKFRNKRLIYAGVCSSALSGSHALIPVVGLGHQYSGWQISVGYPHSKIILHLDPKATVYSDWSLSGNEWEILDKNLQNRSSVKLESKRLRLGLRIRFLNLGLVEMYRSYSYDQQLEYLARDGARISANIDKQIGWMINYTHFW